LLALKMNIKENLVKMIDLSKVSLDLAYLSLIEKNRMLDKEIENIQKEIGTLKFETEKLVFKIMDKTERKISILDLLDYIKEVNEIAIKISGLKKKETHPLISDVLNEISERIIRIKITKNDIISTQKLSKRYGIKVLMIKRGKETILPFKRNILLKRNDLLFIIGSEFDKDVINEIYK